MLASVEFYNVVLFFHLLAVVLALGPTFSYPVFLAVAERTDPRALPAVGRGIVAWDRIGQILLLVILATGIYLVASDARGWEFSNFYVSWGLVAVIIVGGVSGAYFTPKTRQLVKVAERDIAAAGEGEVKLSDEFQALNKQLGAVGTVVGLVIILTIYVMTAKPFL